MVTLPLTPAAWVTVSLGALTFSVAAGVVAVPLEPPMSVTVTVMVKALAFLYACVPPTRNVWPGRAVIVPTVDAVPSPQLTLAA